MTQHLWTWAWAINPDTKEKCRFRVHSTPGRIWTTDQHMAKVKDALNTDSPSFGHLEATKGKTGWILTPNWNLA